MRPSGAIREPEWKFAVTADGRPSVTHYETVEMMRGASLLRVHLETGRTHQIRVHFAALHHPCVGDPLYGADPVLAAQLEPSASGCTPPTWASCIRATASTSNTIPIRPQTCSTPWRPSATSESRFRRSGDA